MVAESWFRGLWKTSKKHEDGSEKALIGVLAFEVASMMSKLVHLWQSLSDKQVTRLREEIMNSVGIRKLVSEDDEFIVGLICAEITENLRHVLRSVVRLSEKCNETSLKSFGLVFDDFVKTGADPYGWEFSWKKMERKVKKMERFILVNANLYQEMEMLAELEQTLRRMKGSDGDSDCVNLVELQKKVAWKQQEVKNLQELSLWKRTYDYTVRLLARSLVTIFGRIKYVFGINQMADVEEDMDSRVMNCDYINRSHSVSALMLSSVHPSENSRARFASGRLRNSTTKSGPILKMDKTSNFYSGPLKSSTTKSGPISGMIKTVNFYSGPLGKAKTKSGRISGISKMSKKLWWTPQKSSDRNGKKLPLKPNRLTQVGPFKGCMMVGNNSPSINLHSKQKLLNAPPETLGAAALSLHYANVIIIIEKLVASPHLIGHDARDDLYREWSEAMAGILEWLAPLAHNMIRWQSERSFEQQNLVSRTNVLLVQTLYFADQEKTEAIITELLVGLNYIWRFGRELNAKALLECASSKIFEEYLDLDA
ncbi:hypothetical protein CK203_111655 [Vitis vinifera]|uniref:DUF668 domain-containing protein n=1 Tax=Vitis vinifera TaxID=29760 RepID=A0A438CB81_VITVI|nr:hypothetical protein CK203_111655 [Vitis vinifera]